MKHESPPPNYDETSPSVTNPHDKTFKLMFKEKEIAQDVIRVNLPDEIVSNLDFSTMKLADGTFVSQELAETFSDVLYRVQSETHHMYIAFLFEHKSAPDKFASLQVGKYIYDLWEEHLREKDKVPIVVPIVFYHGLSPWNYATNMRDLIPDYISLPKYYRERIPAITHDLIDMRTQDDEFIELYEPLTRLTITSFKYVFYTVDELIEAFLKAYHYANQFISEEDLDYYIHALLLYFTSANREFTEHKLQGKIKELDGKGETIMTILDRREKKGIEKGTYDTKIETAYRLLRMDMDVQDVVKVTDLPVEQVKNIKREIENETK